MIVAIDGPAGAGKSSVALRLSQRLGLTLVDTGAIYRATALAARERGLALDDGPALAKLLPELEGALSFDQLEGKTVAKLGTRDISEAIRHPELSKAASAISALPVVRDGLLELQRRLGRSARPPGAVLEGRDIGTVVFPDAEAKFFLTASPEVRAERRHRELLARGLPSTFEAVLADQQQRDHDDSTRAIAPLRQASDAPLIDSTTIDLDQVVDQIVAALRARALL